MKKSKLTLLLFLLLFGLWTQSNGQVKPISVYENIQTLVVSSEVLTLHPATDEGLRIRLDLTKIRSLVAARPKHLAIQIPNPSGAGNWVLELAKKEILSPDFKVSTSDGKTISGEEILASNLFFHGKIQGNSRSKVAITLTKKGLEGVILTGDKTFDLGHEKGQAEDVFVLYNSSQIFKKLPFNCNTEEPIDQPSTQAVSGPYSCTRQFRNYLECDFKMYQDFGSNVANVTTYVTGMFNVVALIYDNENILATVSEIFVWTSNDPYSVNSTTSEYLTQYKSTRTTFNGDICHLLSTRPIGIGGRAYLNALCDPVNRHGFSNIDATFSNFPVYSWTVFVVSHEIGHNLGSPHTHSCSWPGGAIDNCGPSAGVPFEGTCTTAPTPAFNTGTIMSYCHLTGTGINLASGFGPLPGNLIRNKVGSATCLTYGPGSTPLASACAVTTSNPNNLANMGPIAFNLNTINVVSKGSGYGVYEDLSCTIGTSLLVGNTYPFTITTETNPQNVRMYIDYNGDNVFAVGELVYSANGSTSPQTYSGSFTVPAGTIQNVYRRLRIVADFTTNANPQPCGNLLYGQADDYRVIFTSGTLSSGVISSGNQTFCSGSADPGSITFLTSPTIGANLQWYKKEGLSAAPFAGDPVGTWEIIPGQNSLSYDPPSGLTASRTYACRVTNGISTIWASGVRQIRVLPVLVFGTLASGNQTFNGSGDPAAISLSTTASGGLGTFSYQWYSASGIVAQPTGTTIPTGWAAISGATSASYDPPVISASKSYALRVNPGILECSNPTWASGIRQVTIIFPGIIASGNQSLCSPGDPASIAFSTAAMSGSTFQWYYQDGIIAAPANTAALTGWTSIAGATAVSYDPPAGLITSRTFACRVNNPAISQWATGVRQITINPLPEGFEISEAGWRCGPGPVTITGQSDLISTGIYEWYTAETGGLLISTGNPFTFNFTSSNTVWMSVISNEGCTSKVRKPYSVLVFSLSDFGVLSSGNQSLISPCDPSLITFSSNPPTLFAPTSAGYQWYYKDGIVTQPSGSSTTGWTLIPGAIEISYDPPAGLTSSRTYACLVNRAVCGDIGWASGIRQVTVTPFSSGNLASANQILCNPADPASIAFSTAATAGSAYQWYFQNGIIAAPANTAALTGWTSIAGASAATYDPPTGLTASRTYACRVTNGTNSQWASGVRQITVRAVLNYGTITAGNQSFTSSGNPAVISLSAAASGGSGTFSYQWYSASGIVAQPSGTSIPAAWIAITGASTASYDPPVISASTSYALRVDPTGTPDCGVATWASGVRQITVTPATTFSPGTLASGNQTLCNPADPAAIAFSIAATTGSSFQWYFQSGIIAAPANTAALTGWTSITGATSASYDPPTGLTASRTFACRVTNGINSQWATSVRQITVLLVFNPGSLIANQSGCTGYNPNPITMATNPVGSGAYNWKWFYVENTTATCPTGSADPTGWTSSTTDVRFFGTSTTGTGISFDPSSAGAAGRTWVLKITPASNGSTPACGTARFTNCHKTTLLTCRLAEEEQNEFLTNEYFLGNAQPNPWEDKTEIQFQLPAGKESGKIIIRSLEGKIVHVQEVSGEARQSVSLSRGNWPAGVYFYSLETGNEVKATRKMVLIQ